MGKSSKVKIVLNRSGVRDLLRSPEVRADIDRRARAVSDAAGEGFDYETEIGPNRARAAVWTADRDAMIAEAKDRSLTRAIHAAGG